LNIIASPAGPVCQGTEIKLTATPVNGGNSPSFQWKKNGTDTGGNTATFSSEFNNGDVISCVLISNASCPSSNNVLSNVVTLKVNPLVIPSVNIAASPSDNICEQSEVKFHATVVNGGNSPSFQWKKNGIVMGVNSVSYSEFSLKNGDEIVCTVTSKAECLAANQATSNTIPIKVNPILTPTVTISSDAGESACSGKEVIFTAKPVNAGIDPVYQWKKNGKNVGINSANYSDKSLVNGDEISCEITTSAKCYSQKEAASNFIELAVKMCE